MADVVKTITGLNFHNYCHIAAALLLDNQITARADEKINAVELEDYFSSFNQSDHCFWHRRCCCRRPCLIGSLRNDDGNDHDNATN